MMKTALTTAAFLLLMLSGNVWSQGHPNATPEKSITIERSSEHRAEGKEFEREVPVKLEYYQEGCAATLGLEYYQKGTHAHVRSTLRNEQCAASSGSYTITIRYRPDEGEQGEVRFEESWSRDDGADVVTEKDYYVGEDLEVRRVSSSNLTCTCTTADEADPEAASRTSERLRHKDRE
jgi:hypothetical protein